MFCALIFMTLCAPCWMSMCVQKSPSLATEFAKKLGRLWNRGALSHEAAGECNNRSHTSSSRPPTLVGAKVDWPAERPLARLLRSRSVGVTLRPLCPPLPQHIRTVWTMGGSDVLKGHARKHGSHPILPRESADIGDTGVHAGLGPDPHHHGWRGMLTHTTLTCAC